MCIVVVYYETKVVDLNSPQYIQTHTHTHTHTVTHHTLARYTPLTPSGTQRGTALSLFPPHHFLHILTHTHTHTHTHTQTHSSNVAARRSYTVHGQSYASSRLGNVGAGLERVIDSLNAVLLHADEEAGGELVATGASIEQRRGGVSEPALRHQVVGLWGS